MHSYPLSYALSSRTRSAWVMSRIGLLPGQHGQTVRASRSFRCAARHGALMLADDCDFEGRRAKRGVHLSYRQHLAEGRLTHLAAMNFSSL